MSSSLTRRGMLFGVPTLALVSRVAYAAARQLGSVTVGEGGEACLVLHEWMGDHTNYDAILPYLSRSRYTYVFADLRGYGLSRAIEGAYTVEEAAADILSLMDGLGHARFHLVGHSMSGLIVQYLMATAPERIGRVVAISPVPASGFKADAATLARLRAVITDDDAARAFINSRTGRRYDRSWLDYKLAIARRASPAALDGYLAMFTSTDVSARVAGLETPVSVIVGDQDIPFYSRATVEPLFRGWYPRLQIASIHDAGHYSMLETPVLLAALLERGLAGQPLQPADRAERPARPAEISSQSAT